MTENTAPGLRSVADIRYCYSLSLSLSLFVIRHSLFVIRYSLLVSFFPYPNRFTLLSKNYVVVDLRRNDASKGVMRVLENRPWILFAGNMALQLRRQCIPTWMRLDWCSTSPHHNKLVLFVVLEMLQGFVCISSFLEMQYF